MTDQIHKEQQFSEEFDTEYKNEDVDVWATGIVASALIHERMEGFGADASYITAKLISLVKARDTRVADAKYKEGYEEGFNEALKKVTLTKADMDSIHDNGFKYGREAALREVVGIVRGMKKDTWVDFGEMRNAQDDAYNIGLSSIESAIAELIKGK